MSWVRSRKSKASPSGKNWYYCYRDQGKIETRRIPNAFTREQAELIQKEWDELLSTSQVELSVTFEELAGALIAADQNADLSPRYIEEKKRYFRKSLFPFLGEILW